MLLTWVTEGHRFLARETFSRTLTAESLCSNSDSTTCGLGDLGLITSLSLGLGFLTCKLGIKVFNSWACCED